MAGRGGGQGRVVTGSWLRDGTSSNEDYTTMNRDYDKPPPGIPDDDNWRSLSDETCNHNHGYALANGWDGESDDTTWLHQTQEPWHGYIYRPNTWMANWGSPDENIYHVRNGFRLPMAPHEVIQAGRAWPPPPRPSVAASAKAMAQISESDAPEQGSSGPPQSAGSDGVTVLSIHDWREDNRD